MKSYVPWGKSVAINLYDCDIGKISNPKIITQYIRDIIPKIGMVAHGPCHIDRFGKGKLEGYSAMQFIETSSITVHCDEPRKRCFVDIFSCKEFDGKKAVQFTKTYFGARKKRSKTLIR